MIFSNINLFNLEYHLNIILFIVKQDTLLPTSVRNPSAKH